MNATIDIKTPSGQSLEGFPCNVKSEQYGDNLQGVIGMLDDWMGFADDVPLLPFLHKGDRIIIEIGE